MRANSSCNCLSSNNIALQRGKTYLLTCHLNKNRSAYPHSLIRIFVVHMKKLCTLGYPYPAHRDYSDQTGRMLYPASILYKSTAGRYRPVSYPDGPITARCRFLKYWLTLLSLVDYDLGMRLFVT